MQRRELPDGWQGVLPTVPTDAKGIASRDSSGQVLNALAQAVPWLLGGSADVALSTRTLLTFPSAGDFQADDRSGRNLHLGVREHAAAAIANGMALTKLDGPTHQPVEQLASLRAMPGLLVFRPADANEVVETWRIVAELQREPAALKLSRQPLPTLDRNRLAAASGVAMGGYVLADAPSGDPDVILLATGSAGTGTWGTPARSSACTRSAPPRRSNSC
jgi:transketolase